jgi:hypothetical protein
MRFFLLLAVFVCKGIFAQPINLVPNPGFEIYDTCPFNITNPPYSGTNAICRAIPWFQPNRPHIACSGSSDFYHSCSGTVPSNIYGYQFAKTGLGYAGFGPSGNPNVEGGEYIEVSLTNSLKPKKYCTTFYINTPSVEWSSTNCIQARFTKDSVLNSSWDRIYLSDGIGATEIIRDTVNWILVKGIYDANLCYLNGMSI